MCTKLLGYHILRDAFLALTYCISYARVNETGVLYPY